MENKRIELIPFEKNHFDFLNKEIPDSKFLMQWAGPKYYYPLTWEQMKNKIEEIDVDKTNRNHLFSVSFKQTRQIVGHVQLSIIDSTLKIGNVGSVMVFNQFRNNGISKEIIKEILKFGFSQKGIEEIRLAVFDFNLPALNCYKNTGFRMFEYNKNVVKIENEKWNSIRMKIMKSEYQKT